MNNVVLRFLLKAKTLNNELFTIHYSLLVIS